MIDVSMLLIFVLILLVVNVLSIPVMVRKCHFKVVKVVSEIAKRYLEVRDIVSELVSAVSRKDFSRVEYLVARLEYQLSKLGEFLAGEMVEQRKRKHE